MVSVSDLRTLQKGYAAGPGNRRLRANVFFAVAVEIAFLVFLTVFIWNHADPMGDGMEMVGVSMAFIFSSCRSRCRRSCSPKRAAI